MHESFNSPLSINSFPACTFSNRNIVPRNHLSSYPFALISRVPYRNIYNQPTKITFSDATFIDPERRVMS